MTSDLPAAGQPGRLIAISGVDGSGKSTLLAGLATALRARGGTVTSLAALKPRIEPALGWLRDLPAGRRLRAQAELWMAGYFALVFQHNLAMVVEPALRRGDWVLADRWSLDHVANQAALDVDLTLWRPALEQARRPDAHYLIDVPSGLAARRIAQRGDPPGIGSGDRFLRRCATQMRSAATDPAFAPVTILDGTWPPAQLLAAVLDGLPGGGNISLTARSPVTRP